MMVGKASKKRTNLGNTESSGDNCVTGGPSKRSARPASNRNRQAADPEPQPTRDRDNIDQIDILAAIVYSCLKGVRPSERLIGNLCEELEKVSNGAAEQSVVPGTATKWFPKVRDAVIRLLQPVEEGVSDAFIGIIDPTSDRPTETIRSIAYPKSKTEALPKSKTSPKTREGGERKGGKSEKGCQGQGSQDQRRG